MRDTILLFFGTAAGAVGLEFERKRAAEVARLSRRLAVAKDGDAAAKNGDAAAIARRIEELRDSVHVAVFDVDTTGVYPLNAPLTNILPTLPVGRFVPCPMPGPDMVQHIKAGRHRGRFEYLNADAVLALETHGSASGGARANGWLAVETNTAIVDQQIRSKFEAILKRRLVQSRPLDEHVRMVMAVGTFGGFGTGSLDVCRRRAIKIARDLQLVVDLFCLALVPGTNAPKDPENTLALTHGVLKELIAQSTRYHWHREKHHTMGAEMVKSIVVPTLFVSDTNHAPGDPQALSIENFNGMVAELLRAITLSDLGSRLEAQWGDFAIPAQQLTATGEPRAGRSVGVATIHLDRDRLLRFSTARLTDRALSVTLGSVDAKEVAHDVRAFLEAHRFVEGERVRQLAERLLERGTGQHGLIDIERFRCTFHNNTSQLVGMPLLADAPGRLHLTIQQAGNLDAALAGRADAAQRQFVADAETRTSELARDQRKGAAFARQWVEEAIAIDEHMVAEAAKDTPHFEAEVTRHQRRIDHFHNIYIPQVRRRGWLYRWLMRHLIEADAEEYRRCLEDLHVARMHLAAHLRAIELLNAVREPLKARLGIVQTAVDNIADERNAARSETERMAQHRPDFDCPVGLPLISSSADLEEYYARLLPEGGEDQAVADVHARLLKDDDPFVLAGNPARLHAEVERAAERTFLDQVEALHVVTELRRKFPDREQLGAVLRRRIHESFEYLQLKDSCDQENGVFLVRLLGLDSNRLGDLVDVLGRYDYSRGVSFQVVNTEDPERIVFLQFRAVFPMSEWGHFARSHDIYDRVSELMPFEKYHVVPGERALPVPGELLSDLAARIVAFKAWSCGRLTYDARTDGWQLASADNTEMPLALGDKLAPLTGIEGYRRAVDVSSHYTSVYLARGPEPILDEVQRVVEIREGRKQPTDISEERLAALVDARVLREIERELDRWRRNSVPAAMEWGANALEVGRVGPIPAAVAS